MQLSPAEVKAIRHGKQVRRRLLIRGIGFLAVGMVWFLLKLAGAVGVLHIEAHALLVSIGVAVILATIWIDITPYDVLQRYVNQDPEALRQLASTVDEAVVARR